jgi:hypothetical protein
MPIKDEDSIRNIRSKWRAACKFRERVPALANASGIGLPASVRDISNNLVFLFGYQCFDDVLRLLENEGIIRISAARNAPNEKIPRIEQILRAGNTQVSWVDWRLASDANTARNDIAHGRKIRPRDQCWNYMDYIQAQLTNWSILPK